MTGQSSSVSASCETTRLEVELGRQGASASADGTRHWIAFAQQAWRGAEPPALDGDPVRIAEGVTGYRSEEDGAERLIWYDSGILAILVSPSVPFEELLRIAESAEPIP